MSNKLIIAAAGSGKTTFLVKQALSIHDGRVLITTFTEANEQEINKKFIEINGCVPPHVTVQTWFSFLLQHGVKPYQSVICDHQSDLQFKSRCRLYVAITRARHSVGIVFDNKKKIVVDGIQTYSVEQSSPSN